MNKKYFNWSAILNIALLIVANVSTDDDSRKLAQNKEIAKWLSKITFKNTLYQQ